MVTAHRIISTLVQKAKWQNKQKEYLQSKTAPCTQYRTMTPNIALSGKVRQGRSINWAVKQSKQGNHFIRHTSG